MVKFAVQHKKEVNTELDLVAFISLLSVFICFLLLTTIWIQIGSMSVKQAVGGQPAEAAQPKPELWVVYDSTGTLKFDLRNSPQKIARKYSQQPIAAAAGGKPNLKELASQLAALKAELTEVSVALIRPTEKTIFEDIISVMDTFREKGFNDLGVTPL